MAEIFTYASPETVGMSSDDILAFIDELEENGLNMHSVMVIRHGKIAAEGYWKPFHRDFRHRMYYISKSFVAGAIGLLLDEGRISLSDRVCKYFPEYPEENLHPYTRETTVRDLLIMASPFELTYSLWGNARNTRYWVESFFTAAPKKPAGTVFCYDTTASFILDVIAERVTGMKFMDYLYEKILYKVDFSKNVRCIQSPDGYSWGGSGVLCTTLDLAKFAYIFLNGGKVGKEQLISAEFVKEATAKQIDTDVYGHGGNIYSTHGYGYQIWRNEENGFAFNGMGNQHAFCYPDKDLLVVCTADNQGKQPESARVLFTAVKNHLVKKCADAPLAENEAGYNALKEKLKNLTLNMPKGEKTSMYIEKINGKRYVLNENSLGWEWMDFEFCDGKGTLCYKNARGEKSLSFGLGEYLEGELPETEYSGEVIGIPLGRGYRYVGTGVWWSERQLLLRFNIIDDYIGNLTFAFSFNGNKVGFRASKAAEGFLDDYQGLAGGEISVRT